jgi:hypothetical protein
VIQSKKVNALLCSQLDVGAIISEAMASLTSVQNPAKPFGLPMRPIDLVTQLDGVTAHAQDAPTVEGQHWPSHHSNTIASHWSLSSVMKKKNSILKLPTKE